MILFALIVSDLAAHSQECAGQKWLTDSGIRRAIVGRTIIHDDFADHAPYNAVREERFSTRPPIRQRETGALAYTYLSMNRSGGGEYVIRNGSLCVRLSNKANLECRRVSMRSDDLVFEFSGATGRVCTSAKLNDK